MPTSSPELTARLAAARDAPAGTVVAVDESAVLEAPSAVAFAGEALRAGRPSWRSLPAEAALVAGFAGDGGEPALRRLVAGWRGADVHELARRARTVFTREVSAGLRPEMWTLLAEHRRRGHRVVLTGSGTDVALRPLADEIAAESLVATPVEVVDGRVTGNAGPVRTGAAKVAGLPTAFPEDIGFAYAGGADDEPLLAAAVRPVVVGDDPGARALAGARDWPVLPTAARDAAPGDLARTVAFYGGLLGALGAGAAVGLTRGERRPMIDVASGVGGGLGLALAGVELDVTGTEHLWSSRPCVFVFNHQSKLDVAVLMALLREGFTGVAKQEARAIPVWGQMFALAGVAFVRRGDPAQARAALEPAVEKIRDEGWSLAIAPEGTRSATPRLGRFKKGAFHIAMQAGVPIVPIVLHDAGELMWRGAQTLRPGTVHVEVLPPVDTSSWTVDDLGVHVAHVRALFTAALEGEDT